MTDEKEGEAVEKESPEEKPVADGGDGETSDDEGLLDGVDGIEDLEDLDVEADEAEQSGDAVAAEEVEITEESTEQETSGDYELVVEMTEVTKRYVDPKGETLTAVEDVNLTIEDVPEAGEFHSILGPSGCGKSTILKLIAGLETPSEGTVKVGGDVVDGPGPERGMVFQSYSSMPWMNVKKNVAYGMRLQGIPKNERMKKAQKFIERVGLKGHEAKYPGELSGGMRQRVAIARTLAVEPKIMLMDEPFGALDVHTRFDMQNFVEEIWERQEATIVFVTHDVSEAVYLSDRIHILSASPGTIVEEISVDLPRPRTRETKQMKEFRVLQQEILELIHQVGAASGEVTENGVSVSA